MSPALRPVDHDVDDDDAIFKVDTVPPPAGEDDAYNATTKVGEMARGLVDKMMADAEREDAAASSGHRVPAFSDIRALRVPSTPRVPAELEAPSTPSVAIVPTAAARPPEAEEPWVFDAADESDQLEPTSLFGAAPSGATAQKQHAMVQSVVEQVDRRQAHAQPPSGAPKAAAPVSAPPVATTTSPPVAAAPAPASTPRPEQTLELAIFATTLLALALAALYVFLR